MLFTFVIFNTYRVLNCAFGLFKSRTSVAVSNVPPFTASIYLHLPRLKRIPLVKSISLENVFKLLKSLFVQIKSRLFKGVFHW